MKMPVVPYVSLLLTASFFLATGFAPTVEACHVGQCYNERYVAAGASVLEEETVPPYACLVEPCGDGGVSFGGAYTDSHGEYNSVLVNIRDAAFEFRAALGLCAMSAEGECVEHRDVKCGTNYIAFGDITFTGVQAFTPHFAVTEDLRVCGATTGVVKAHFSNSYLE